MSKQERVRVVALGGYLYGERVGLTGYQCYDGSYLLKVRLDDGRVVMVHRKQIQNVASDAL